MGWAITLAVLLLLAILPLGVAASYDATGARVSLVLGVVRLRLYPREKKKKSQKQQKTKKKPEETPPKAQPAPEKPPEKKGGSWKDFLPLVKTGLAFLGDFRRKLRIDLLECRVILGGGDPASTAMAYGRAWAALGNLLNAMEAAFAIRRRDVEVECDFTATETLVTARAQITITLGRLVWLVVRYGLRALKDYLHLRKMRKGGLNHE